MVKVLVNGSLFEISKVEEIVEKRVPFNGPNIRLVQIAQDSKQAVSGLHFQVKNTECNVFAIGEFTIGNGVNVTRVTEENHPEGLISPDAFNGKSLLSDFMEGVDLLD